ncbi:MAG TPA: M23 family metallopeptidase [Dermatophilaceae bacterium]|nr:M23 family metallopeptidase [Dermatophilaceae bacterium]
MRRGTGSAGPRTRRVLGTGAALVCAVALTTTVEAGAAPVLAPLAAPSLMAPATPLTAAAGLPGAPDPNPRDAKRKVDAGIVDSRDDLAETNAALAKAYDALAATNAKLPSARATLTRATAAAAAADRAHAEAVQALAVARADEAKAQDELASTAHSITEGRGRVAQFAAQMYQEQGFGQLDAAVSSGSPQEFADRVALVGTVMDVQSRSLDRLATAQASQTAQEDHLSALRADASAASARAEEALAAATSARDRSAAAKVALDRLAAAQTAQAAELDAQAAAERRRLTDLEAESDRLTAVLRARAAAAKRAAAALAAAGRASSGNGLEGAGFLAAPTLLGRISSEFGMRYHPILRYSRLHGGRDYASGCGTPIKAAASGVVVSAGWGGGFGNRVVLDHGIHQGVNLSTSYNHLERIATRGGRVAQGQVIGYEGTTGLSTGCHLHFEVYEDGVHVDPRKWL